jgi:hypothetical protein
MSRPSASIIEHPDQCCDASLSLASFWAVVRASDAATATSGFTVHVASCPCLVARPLMHSLESRPHSHEPAGVFL